MPSLDLFGQRPRRPRRVMMHIVDAGVDAQQFECAKCGHNTGWVEPLSTISQARSGVPCPKCNGG